MTAQSDDGQATRNAATWRGDFRPLWALVVVFSGLILAVALIIELTTGLTGWLLMLGALISGWLIPVATLLRWSAAAGGRYAGEEKEEEVRARHS